jgi:BlaI family transcriptional regulator, penicillinase repressor
MRTACLTALLGGTLPRSQSAVLTDAELRLMEVLWQKGPATIHEVLQALPPKPALAYNSVLTTIRILEKKGYVEHAKSGKAHIYRPRVDRTHASRSAVRHLVSRFFKNSHELLVLNLLDDKSVDAAELQRLRQLLDEHK